MPLGSSSDAPVINPGPKTLSSFGLLGPRLREDEPALPFVAAVPARSMIQDSVGRWDKSRGEPGFHQCSADADPMSASLHSYFPSGLLHLDVKINGLNIGFGLT